jgi:hypothetical protein
MQAEKSSQRAQEGSGSAENTGQERDQQKPPKGTIDQSEKNRIAAETGLKPEDIAGLKETGARSGRDDSAGGSGDQMEEVSDRQPTEKF